MTVLEQRLSVHDVDPAAYRAVLGLAKHVRGSGLDPRLHELVKIVWNRLAVSTGQRLPEQEQS